MDNEAKTWSNARGYGKINIYEFNKDRINLSICHWNKLDNLKKPFFTNVDTNLGWTNKEMNNHKYSKNQNS